MSTDKGRLLNITSRTAIMALFAGSLAYAAPAAAQEDDAAEAEEGNVIIVTAQRRAEDLQDVPAAVTALGADDLEIRQIADTNDLQNQIPSVVISTGTGTASSARIFFRGVGEDESRGAIDPAVGIYIDNVYLGRTVGSLVDLVDIGSVEVLRGPQGTLYGRNTNGGAIKITSVAPEIGVTSISADFGYGEFDRIQGRASANIGINDSLALRVSGLYKERDGFHTLNPNGDFAALAGTNVGDEEVYAVRASLLGELDDNWTAQFIFDYTQDNTDPTPSSIIDDSDDPSVVTDVDDNIFTVEPAAGVTCSALTPATFQPIGCFTDFNSEVESYGASIQLEGNYDKFSITSITAFRVLTDDLSSHITFPFFQTTDQNQFSQELIFNTDFDGPFNFTAGAYYYSEDVDLDFTFVLPVTNEVETESFSLFGQGTFDITDQLTLTGGIRWTDETRDFRGVSVIFPGGIEQDVDTSNVTWTAKLDYSFTEDVLVYASFSTGFKSPGFSPDCFSAAACFLPVEEEQLDSIEVGLRTQFWDNRATFNATYYYNDYQDLQISATAGDGSFTRTNAGEAVIQGVELEFSVEPIAGLNIYANGSWLDAEYESLTAFQAGTLSNSNIITGALGPTCTGVTGAPGSPEFEAGVIDCALALELKNAPELKGTIGFNYTTAMADGEIFFGGELAYEDESFGLVANPAGSLIDPGVRIDARIGWRNDRWRVTLWGKNLTDREYFRATTSVNQVFAAPPLTWGIDVGFTFD